MNVTQTAWLLVVTWLLTISTEIINLLKLQLVNKNRACCNLSFVGKACYNLLKQLVADLWIKSFDNRLQRVFRELATDLSQAMRTRPDTGLLQQLVARC